MIKKGVHAHRTIVFAVNASPYLLPGEMRTYALVAQAPILQAPLSREYLSLKTMHVRAHRQLDRDTVRGRRILWRSE